MKIKISLKNKHNNEMLLEKVSMNFNGERNNLLDLIAALKEAKAECNAIANTNSLALKDCEASVFFE
jgi:hypothetical protein